jgi:hypothetical protein
MAERLTLWSSSGNPVGLCHRWRLAQSDHAMVHAGSSTAMVRSASRWAVQKRTRFIAKLQQEVESVLPFLV